MAHLQLGEREGKKKKKEERERNTGVERRQERLGNAPQQALREGERLSQAVPLAALPRRGLASLLHSAPKSGSCQHQLPGAAAHPGGAAKPPQVIWIQGCGLRAAPPFHWENAARAGPNPSSHPASLIYP